MIYTPRVSSVAVFAMIAGGFGVISAWLLQNNYANDASLYNWATVQAILDAESLRMENLGFERPHGPILALAPLHLIPGMQAFSPYVLSVLTSALLLTLWHRHLAQHGFSLTKRVLLLALMAMHPAVLWSATSGGGGAIALLLFYLLYRSCLRMIYEQDIRSFIALGLVLAGFAYFNVVSIYLFVALLPLLLFIVPIPLLRESPFSVYIIIGMPLLIVVVSWIYFNWIFLGEPWAFLDADDSEFLGARARAETLPWLMDFGGEFAKPLVIGLAYALVGYPVLLYLLWRSQREGRQLRISLVLMYHPVISIAIATFTYFLASPLQITTLMIAGVMAEVTRQECLKYRCWGALLVLLVIGLGSSWYMYLKDDYSHLDSWSIALNSPQQHSYAGDVAVGKWLSENRMPTLIDLRSGYRAIVARGDAKGLLLPTSHMYRLAMRSERPMVEQIAVPDPVTTQGKRDEINVRFPSLYESGLTDYKLVYNRDGWRVYRRIN